MPEKIRNAEPPRGLKRILFRLPIWLYRLKLGWLLGNRALLLIHTGRKSGLTRQTVLEVTRYDQERDIYIVAAGFGIKSQWYQNLLNNPTVVIQVGRRKLTVHTEMLTPEQGGEELVSYAKRHPRTARGIGLMLGYSVDGSVDDYRAVGKLIPFVAFQTEESLA